MSVVYLENHTVAFTPELWEFCKSFQFDPSMVPLLLDPVYDTIEFRNILSENCWKAVVKNKRIDRTHVQEVIDLYYSRKIRSGRTAGWRIYVTMDTEADPESKAATHAYPFDLKGNIMQQNHADLSEKPDIRNELIDIVEICQNAFTFVQQVLKFSPGDLESFEDELPVREVKRQHKKKRKNQGPVVATTRLYHSYRIKRSYDFTDRNPIVRQCRLWIVRGHDRRLSDGRTIHIDPYYKGIDRKYARPEDGDFGRQIKVKPMIFEGGNT